jgi:hypothetical protein
MATSRVRAVAFLLLASCAAPLAPSSLPTVRIDRSLEGAVCSRKAAETIATLRIRERTQWSTELNACLEDKAVATSGQEHAEKRADAAEWWHRWGPGLVAGAAASAFVAGVAITSAVLLSQGRR